MNIINTIIWELSKHYLQLHLRCHLLVLVNELETFSFWVYFKEQFTRIALIITIKRFLWIFLVYIVSFIIEIWSFEPHTSLILRQFVVNSSNVKPSQFREQDQSSSNKTKQNWCPTVDIQLSQIPRDSNRKHRIICTQQDLLNINQYRFPERKSASVWSYWKNT